ncbi:MAG: Transcriptional regulatory protein ZraR [Bacteroidota bacterium]|jgi:DNA-binding NarL/FixJ family response regulator
MKWIKPKIFIVDDDSIYLAIMNQQFKNHGVENVTVYESAVDGIKSNFGKPDLVFVDFHMNDINGARASKMFNRKWKNARIVLISNSDSIKKKVKLSRYKIDAAVLKDADFSEIINQVNITKRNIVFRILLRILVLTTFALGVYMLFFR